MRAQVVVVENLEVLWMLVVLSALGLLLAGAVILDVGSKNSHLLIKVAHVVEVVKLPQPQLAVVVV